MIDISLRRLNTQRIASQPFDKPEEAVRYFGAVQAQDYAMAKWAIGCRMKNATDALVEKALDDGKIIRTHVLRPTWHFVAADDLHWMVQLSAPNIKRQMKSHEKQLGIDAKIIVKSHSVIENALSANGAMTRDAIVELWQSHKIPTEIYKSSLLLMHAELDLLICSGARKNGKQTYDLADRLIPRPVSLNREESLRELASHYFKSHGPATLKDFTWWSGLSVADSKAAVEANGSVFEKEEIDGQNYYFTDSNSEMKKPGSYLLPAFDEFLIAYKNRSASIADSHAKHALTINGIFKPLVVAGDQVVGTWKRTVKKDQVLIEILLLSKVTKTGRNAIEKDAARYAAFIGKIPELTFQTA